MINSHFMSSHIARQIGLMNTSVWAEEIAQSCPATFVRVDMHFSDAISIVIARLFVVSVTHSVAYAL